MSHLDQHISVKVVTSVFPIDIFRHVHIKHMIIANSGMLSDGGYTEIIKKGESLEVVLKKV